jgi:hypothetical protein
MTFLQYVCERLLGPPAMPSASPGEAYWRCPFHDDREPSFHTLPHQAGQKDYWKCFGCDLWGDEYNLLRNLRDIVCLPIAIGNYGDHQALLHQWRREFGRSLNASTERRKRRVVDSFSSSVEALNPNPIDWSARAARYARNLSGKRRSELARVLGLPVAVLDALRPIGCLSQGPLCWTFPERDAAGRIIGITCRSATGQKRVMKGSHRGLTISDGWAKRQGPVYLVEGASDVLAMTALSLAAIGRPSNRGGVEHLAGLLRDVPAERAIIVVGEFDPKPTGDWPGRDGAEQTAGELMERLDRPVQWALPPDKAKDVRAWMLAQKPDLTRDGQLRRLGGRLGQGLASLSRSPGRSSGIRRANDAKS